MSILPHDDPDDMLLVIPGEADAARYDAEDGLTAGYHSWLDAYVSGADVFPDEPPTLEEWLYDGAPDFEPAEDGPECERRGAWGGHGDC